jgi:hypothetical protein
MKCSFCGYEFDEPRQACANCPMHASCKATCCPNCGCEIERESKLAEMARRIFKRSKTTTEDNV